MSSIAAITEEKLLKNKDVRHVLHNGEWYFSVFDLNMQYLGAFKNNHNGAIILRHTIRGTKDLLEDIACIPFSKVSAVAQEIGDRPELNQAIDVLFGFNQKKK